jgi:viroplasmin and RNaseH domain-containing protein
MAKKYYAYVTFSAVGVSTDWNAVDQIVTGTKGESHKSFKSYEEAANFVLSQLSNEDKRDFSLDRNRLYLNVKFVRLEQYKAEKEAAVVNAKKTPKYYAVITPKKVGIFDQWFIAKKLIESTSKSKFWTFKTLEGARDYIGTNLSEADFEDFGLYKCELYVNKTFVRKKAYIPRKLG